VRGTEHQERKEYSCHLHVTQARVGNPQVSQWRAAFETRTNSNHLACEVRTTHTHALPRKHSSKKSDGHDERCTRASRHTTAPPWLVIAVLMSLSSSHRR
jgi:K+-sensing histidine kinase KdpD